MANHYDLFHNKYFSLYQITDDGPKHLELVNVTNIQFQPSQSFHVQGLLPKRRDLLEMQDGAEFAIMYSQCGNRADFDYGTPVFRFVNCKVKSRYMQNTIYMHDDNVLFVDVVFECDIDIPEWGEQ